MDKLAYLDALKRAMLGLPPATQARTLAYYEQRFVDGLVAGRSEQEVADELDEPRKIAMTLRASAHLSTLAATDDAGRASAAQAPAGSAQAAGAAARAGAMPRPVNALRLAASALGLAIFNLFMIVPALVYAALLFSLYLCALTFYLAGIATTASGLAGVNELVLDWPSRLPAAARDNRPERETRVLIGPSGIEVRRERDGDGARPRAPDDGAPQEGEAEAADQDAPGDAAPPQRSERSRVLRGAEAVADGSVRISTGMDAESRTTQTLVGLGMVLGGIALFLVSLVVSRYTLAGCRRYVQMNRSLLKG